ncbi:MAG: class I SAM-dependent methyltransferase [Chloroflexi bacterium]|nr:class I SAM-dependent methyltransferase [Chloroflexota bacterium]
MVIKDTKTKADFFADALWDYFRGARVDLILAREDGFRSREDISWYFTKYAEFPPHEKRALKFARGRVLDAGCGAGRHSLYLQARGLRVTAMDVSPRIVELARTRGVKDVRVADVRAQLPFHKKQFDTVILFGNNLGIGGTVARFRKMLRELARVTSPRGRILATTRQPSVTNSTQRRYLQNNLQRGRARGQMRVRLVYRGRRGAWFDLLLFPPTELIQIAAQEGWEIAQIFSENVEQGYSVVMEKRNEKNVMRNA